MEKRECPTGYAGRSLGEPRLVAKTVVEHVLRSQRSGGGVSGAEADHALVERALAAVLDELRGTADPYHAAQAALIAALAYCSTPQSGKCDYQA